MNIEKLENNKNTKNDKNNWGGARAGAGRKKIAPELKKKTIRKGKVIYFRLLDDDYTIIENIAKKNNTTVNKYIQNLVIEKTKENNR